MSKSESEKDNLQTLKVKVNVNEFNFPDGLPIHSEVSLFALPTNLCPKNIKVYACGCEYDYDEDYFGFVTVDNTDQLYEIITNKQYEVDATVCDDIVRECNSEINGYTQNLIVTYCRMEQEEASDFIPCQYQQEDTYYQKNGGYWNGYKDIDEEFEDYFHTQMMKD